MNLGFTGPGRCEDDHLCKGGQPAQECPDARPRDEDPLGQPPVGFVDVDREAPEQQVRRRCMLLMGADQRLVEVEHHLRTQVQLSGRELLYALLRHVLFLLRCLAGRVRQIARC